MSPVVMSLLAALSVMLVSLVGVVFTFTTIGSWMRRHLTYLATFSAGVLAVLAYHLVEEAFHESASVAIVAASVVAGALFLEALHYLLPEQHHHHGEAHDHSHTPVDGRRVLFSDAVHNVTDGFLIVPAFFADIRIGIAATAGILLHELVQEISEFFILKEAGYSNARALAYNLAASSAILVGVALALLLSSFELFLSILAGVAAGGFLSVVFRDLLPHAIASIRARGYLAVHILAVCAGIALMLGVGMLVDHESEIPKQQMERRA